MAATVTQKQTPSKAFYGFLEAEHGIFTMLDGVVVFQASETGELRIVERGIDWQALGEVGLCETQAIMDRLHGGFWQIACARLMEVQ
jgi:hypothetical protein